MTLFGDTAIFSPLAGLRDAGSVHDGWAASRSARAGGQTMTITINGDLVLDERAGLQNSANSDDDDLSWSSFQTALSASLYSRLFSAGGLNLPANTTGATTFPQVASQSGLISL